MTEILAVDPSTVVTALLTLLVAVAVVGVILALATDDRDPSVVLAWLFVILLVPVLGIVAYFFIGRNYRRETRRRNEHRAATDAMAARSLTPVVTATHTFTEAAVKSLHGTPGARLESVGRHEGGSVVLPADSVQLYFSGKDKFRDLFSDMSAAKQYIHLMYLIWEQDELTSQVTDILQERLRAGVEVRIIYDWLSSMPFHKDELKKLAAAGATVVPCYKRLRQLNYRNHMKMAVVDGELVYSGGMNMGQEYVDGGKRFDTWRDTHFRMTGPAIAPYLSLFATTWLLTGRSEDLFTDYLRPAVVHGPGEGAPVQVLHSSVSTHFPTIRDVYVAALTTARERVWVQSPYFVPDEPLITAMCVAAASGVDVRFMMTGVPDKKLPFYAAHAYYKKLLDAGVTVYQYKAGFLHSKTVTVDDETAIVGTCNWDIRSLILHDEVVSVFYDEKIARTCGAAYERDIAGCSKITLDDLSALNAWQRLRNSVYRLTSRLL